MGPTASWIFLTLLLLAIGVWALDQIDQSNTDRED